ELQDKFPGVLEIVKTWFLNYKGPGQIEVLGFSEQKEANLIIDKAVKAF
ncbi:MAG: inorganic diphosphatase, partial [Flavobacteriales bacterium]|nr:inorganic diphosphatase [Flavobacteriales bacterium]